MHHQDDHIPRPDGNVNMHTREMISRGRKLMQFKLVKRILAGIIIVIHIRTYKYQYAYYYRAMCINTGTHTYFIALVTQ